MRIKIDIPKGQIESFCRRYGVHRLVVLGPALREDLRQEGDIDILIDFEPGVRVGFVTFLRIQEELSRMLGRKVDLNTRGFLSPYFREEVVRGAEVIYEQT